MPRPLKQSPRAGELAFESELIDLPKLLRFYENVHPDPNILSQQVRFGTSGHRGSSLSLSFNQDHITAITQAICNYRELHEIDGPVFIGYDTHALSRCAYRTAVEVLAFNGVRVFRSMDDEFTPTPVISYAILRYNKGRTQGFADGIVVTPSHNPPSDGGIKYNSTHGGPAQTQATQWIQFEANRLLCLGAKGSGLSKVTWEQAIKSDKIISYDFITPYVEALGRVIDFEVIQGAQLSIGVDPMGGAGVNYWERIADVYGLNLTITNSKIDSRFGFIPMDWDGAIRMDPSSPYAMKPLMSQKAKFDISFACDTDHDRHGIVSSRGGLLSANQYLSAAAFYLWGHRAYWSKDLSLGKTVVSTSLLNKVAHYFGRSVLEVPVGFKWFEEGLYNEKLGLAAEESGGASLLRINGEVWTTDKDGIVLGLLAGEITARLGYDPWRLYQILEDSLGTTYDSRVDAFASAEQLAQLFKITGLEVQDQELAGEKIQYTETRARGDLEAINGIKMTVPSGWVALRPSGTESLYKVYAESFKSREHLNRLLESGMDIVDGFLK